MLTMNLLSLSSRYILLASLLLLFNSWSENTKWKVTPWLEADLLFKQDPRFRGGDGAYSIDLGNQRVLWLMGDSFISSQKSLSRKGSTMIRNCVAIQSGYDPSNARMRYTWRYQDSTPTSFFPERGKEWFWPGHGTMISDRLLLFLMRIGTDESLLGFRATGWDALLVENPQEKPRFWKLRELHSPPNQWDILIGSASVMVEGDFLYALGVKESGSRGAYLIRFSNKKAYHGDLSNPFWWDSRSHEWRSQKFLSNPPPPLFDDSQTEFTIHHAPERNQWVQIQTSGFGGANIASRHSSKLTGVWSGLSPIHTPEEAPIPNILIYAGKAHPELEGADMIITYATNTLDFAELILDENLYFPRFLRLDRK